MISSWRQKPRRKIGSHAAVLITLILVFAQSTLLTIMVTENLYAAAATSDGPVAFDVKQTRSIMAVSSAVRPSVKFVNAPSDGSSWDSSVSRTPSQVGYGWSSSFSLLLRWEDNYGNALKEDGLCASITNSYNTTRSTCVLNSENYGFNIPAGASITGIKVAVKSRANLPNCVRVGFSDLYTATGGSGQRINRTDLPTSLSWVVSGGDYDLWDTSWNASEINDRGFGYGISFDLNSTPAGATVYVDVVTVTVYFRSPTISASNIVLLAVIPACFVLLAVGYTLRARSKRNREAVQSEPYQEELPSIRDEEAGKSDSWTGLNCVVCNLPLQYGDDVVWCPHCLSPAHRTHLLEWLHVKGTCPMCGRELDERELKQSPPRMIRPRNQKGGR